MRWGLLGWIAIGTAVVALKAHVDVRAERYPDLATGTGPDQIHIPRALIESDGGWRADVLKLAGCWDHRDGVWSEALAELVGCHLPRSVELKIPDSLVGVERSYASAFRMTYWMNYRPSLADIQDATEAWQSRGAWQQRQIVYNAAWGRFMLTSSATPWVVLLAREPMSPSVRDISMAYAGKCYKPDTSSAVGMTCTFVHQFGHADAIEYGLSLDDVQFAATLHQGVHQMLLSWSGADPLPSEGIGTQ